MSLSLIVRFTKPPRAGLMQQRLAVLEDFGCSRLDSGVAGLIRAEGAGDSGNGTKVCDARDGGEQSVSDFASLWCCLLVFEARLIVSQLGSHVFSQPPSQYSRISTAPLTPSYGYTRIKGHLLIKPLINTDYNAIRALSIYKKALLA